MIIQESDLQFDFDEAHWWVKKYDDHRFYKMLSGSGLKGVDFIGIYQRKEIIFLEVKNYRSKHPTRQASFKVLDETKAFINHVGDKLEDTFRAITVIIAYYRRQWWYNLSIKLIPVFPRSWLLRRDWYFWYRVGRLINEKCQLQFVVWLEIEEGISDKGKRDLSNYIDKSLSKQLEEFTCEVHVASVERPVFRESLRVRFL